MKRSKKNKERLFAKVARALLAAFGPILGRGSPPLENPPRTPGKDYLYVSKRPYSQKNPPPSRDAAEDRLGWRFAQKKDWVDREMVGIYERVEEDLALGRFKKRRHTYRGRPEAVMAAAIKEIVFLRQWLGREREKDERAAEPPALSPNRRDPGRQRPRRTDGHKRTGGRPPHRNHTR